MKIQYIASLAILMGGLVGCGDKPASTTAQKPESTPTQDVIDTAPTLPDDAPVYKVATTGTSTPMSFKSETNQLTGIDVDVITAMGEREGFKVEFIPVKWGELFTGLDDKLYDIAISGISWTEERAGKYGASDSYFFSPAAFAYIDNGKPMTSLADLKGVKVGVLSNTKHEQTAKDAGASEVITTNRGFEAFTLMVQGQVDVFIHDYVDLKEFQKNYPDHKVIIQNIEDESNKNAHYTILTQKDNTELLTKLNLGIEKLKADGTLDKISDKYLGGEK